MKLLSLKKSKLKVGMGGNGSLSRPKLTKSCGAEEEDFMSKV
jgi:hypothetical protein